MLQFVPSFLFGLGKPRPLAVYSPIQAISLLEIFAGLKSNGISSFDLNFLTCLGITSHPGFSVNFLESAETD